MNISFENPDKIHGTLLITLEKDDYQPAVEKELKSIQKKANMPGFRQGHVPAALIKRQYGMSVKLDTVNKIIGEKLYGYVHENKIQMLGEPIANNEKTKASIESDEAMTFAFDIAVAPEINFELDKNDKVDYYNIQVGDKEIDSEIDSLRSQRGHMEKAEEYDAEKRDMLKGDLKELDAEGNEKEGGIQVAEASLMPQYLKDDEQKALFNGAKPGAIIKFNPKKAFGGNAAELASILKIGKEEAEKVEADFMFLVTEISRYEMAEINQELFDDVFGEGNVKDEAEFRNRIAESIKLSYQGNSDFKFMLDARKYIENKVGELTFPDDMLKKIMLMNNKEKGEKFVEDNYEGSIRELKWQLIKEKLAEKYGVKINDEDVKNSAKLATRAQFAQYGMNNLPEEIVEKYATDMLKDKKNTDSLVDHAVELKLTQALKEAVSFEEKSISFDDFISMMKEK